MANTAQRVARLLAIALAALSLAVSLAVFPAPVASEGESPRDSSADSGDGGLAVTLESNRDQLPGGVVEFIATVENKTGRTQTNLTVTMVPEHEEALQYVENSTVGCCAEDGAEVALPTLGRRPTLLTPTFEDHSIWFKWHMTVSECTLRGRWTEVVIAVRTDDIEDISALTRVYILPHTDFHIKRFTVAYDLDTPTPAPGDPVRHTVRIANDGWVTLDDLIVHLNPHDTLDQFLPTVSENASFYIVRQRGEEPGSSVAVDPKWSKPTGRFRLDHLSSGKILVLSWTDYVATDAPIGTVVMPHVSVRAAGSQEWTTVATRFAVSLPRNDLEVDVQAIDPGHLASSYFPGDLVTMRVAVSNRTPAVHDDLRVEIDLPFALSYVEGSTSYSTPVYTGGNARRVADTWIDAGLSLPPIEPGQWSAITFKARVGESVAPMNSVETRVTLRTAESREQHDTISIDVAPKPNVEMTVRDLGPTLAGTEARVSIDIRNTGSVPLTDVRFGWEETCTGVSYVPGTLIVSAWQPTETGRVQQKLIRDDGFVLEQQANNEDVSVPIGDLTIDDGQPDQPGVNSVVVSLRVRIADGAGPGSILALPLSVVARVARNSGPGVVPIVSAVGDGVWWKIDVVESLVTAEEFETAVRDILNRIEDVANEIAATTERTEGLAEEIDEITTATGAATVELGETTSAIRANTDAIGEATERTEGLAEKIEEITTATGAATVELGETTGAIQANTDAIGEATTELEKTTETIGEATEAVGKTAEEVRDKLFDEDPWGQSTQWILRVGGFAALASLIAGLVLPFSLWRGLVWVRRHPPRLEMSVPLWAIDLCRAGATRLATARRRVRDWIDGLWRR